MGLWVFFFSCYTSRRPSAAEGRGTEESRSDMQSETALHHACLFQFAVAIFFNILQLLGCRTIFPIAFVSFVNALCLVERCWTARRDARQLLGVRVSLSRKTRAAVTALHATTTVSTPREAPTVRVCAVSRAAR
jgi:hypothetical protein